MTIWNGQLVRQKQRKIILLLYRYRGATNDQLRRVLYGHLASNRNGQLANVSRFVKSLKDMKLVKSASCHPYSKEELNFLTASGIEYFHENFDISGNNDLKLGFFELGTFGSFNYDILKPPTTYIEHHLMTVNMIIDYDDSAFFRNNLYAVKEYKYFGNDTNERYGCEKKAKLKPDCEMFFLDKNVLIAVEVDTGTERFDKLVDKFNNYRRYFDYCIDNDIDIPYGGILFHTKKGNEKLTVEEDQRWQTILKAAVEGLSYYCWQVDIIGFKRMSFGKMLQDESERLMKLGINQPTKVNEVLQAKQERGENKRKEELRKQKEKDDFQKRKKEKDEQLRQQQLEFKRQQEKSHRIAEAKRIEEENKKKGVFGWFR